MSPAPFQTFFEHSPCILGEGAVIERLRRETDFDLDPHIVNSAFIYEKSKRAALEAIYSQYLDNSEQLVAEAPDVFGRSVGDLKNDPGMKLLGGCCGTDDRHIRQLAKRLAIRHSAFT